MAARRGRSFQTKKPPPPASELALDEFDDFDDDWKLETAPVARKKAAKRSELAANESERAYQERRSGSQTPSSSSSSQGGWQTQGRRGVTRDELYNGLEDDGLDEFEEYDNKWGTGMRGQEAEPNYRLMCPMTLDMIAVTGEGKRVYKRVKDNTTVRMEFKKSTHEIWFWGDEDVIYDIAHIWDKRLQYLAENQDMNQKRRTKSKQDRGEAIPKISDIRREERGERHSMLSPKTMAELPDAPKSHLAYFIFPDPRNVTFPVHRVIGPQDKPLRELRQELSCHIELSDGAKALKVSAPNREILEKVIRRLKVHYIKRMHMPVKTIGGSFMPTRHPVMVVLTHAPDNEVTPLEMMHVSGPRPTLSMFSEVTHYDDDWQHRCKRANDMLQERITGCIDDFVNDARLHDGEVRLRVRFGTAFIVGAVSGGEPLEVSHALKDVIEGQGGMEMFSRCVTQSRQEIEHFKNNLPRTFKEVYDQHRVSYTLHCTYNPDNMRQVVNWQRTKIFARYTKDGRLSNWSCSYFEHRPMAYTGYNVSGHMDWQLEGIMWMTGTHDPDSMHSVLIRRTKIEKNAFMFSNTVDLVVDRVCRKTRTLFESNEEYYVEVTHTEFWDRDAEKDLRDNVIKLDSKPSHHTYSISLYPKMWQYELDKNAVAPVGHIPDYTPKTFTGSDQVPRLLNTIRQLQRIMHRRN
ncbi:hypothetical protein THASP1DRAFT_28673 [Thamnocephalis sphaerospora]|uniref:DUF7905 domain-containing protein n=1 Tax=Thamnocephalis sphaerospora TaxID=78915 RepID=A0A4P9XUB5_9FUNG|nr:hypothetical protein THASP1DRAFT_28673 [Thamnocephalis sphaerospora]|eukprot:RKP09542.1 hypothetical protein THASP1DRAFT_28673 [Thamnocephalis sphaerospora]